MYIKKVIVEGFLPFKGRHEIDFSGGGIVGIKGAYGEDFEQSNRSGKSSFIEAIVWALYGESRAKKDLEVIYDNADMARVSVEIFDPLKDASTLITRTRTKENIGALEIQGHEGAKKRASQGEIDKLTGMTYEEFLFTAFFKQNDINQFMKADPQDKKKILMTWIRASNWPEYEKEAGEFRKELNTTKLKIKTQIASYEEFKLNPEELKAKLAECLTDKERLEKEKTDYDSQAIATEMQLKELDTVEETREKITKLETKIASLRALRQDSKEFEEALHKINVSLAAYPEINKTQFEEAQTKEEKATSTISQLNMEVRSGEDQLDKMANDMTGLCPILKKTCDRVERNPEYEQEIQNKINGYSKRVLELQKIKEKCIKIQKLYRAQAEWKSKKEVLLEKSKNAKQIELQIAECLKEVSDLQKKIPKDLEKKKKELKQKLYILKQDLAGVNAEKSTIDKKIGEIGQSLKNAKEKEERLDALNFELKEVEQDLADVQYVEYMFGKNGIPSMELENSFQEIENDANLILKSLSAPFHLEFEATRELKEYEPTCLACGEPFERGEKTHTCTICQTPREKKKRDELSLKIYEGGNERPFYMDSGGGQIIQSVAIRLALTQLARRRKGSSWGTIFLDELFGQLDQKNRRIMADLVTSTLLSNLGFEQIFMISHDTSLQSSTAKNLIVRRNQEERYSELVMQ